MRKPVGVILVLGGCACACAAQDGDDASADAVESKGGSTQADAAAEPNNSNPDASKLETDPGPSSNSATHGSESEQGSSNGTGADASLGGQSSESMAGSDTSESDTGDLGAGDLGAGASGSGDSGAPVPGSTTNPNDPVTGGLAESEAGLEATPEPSGAPPAEAGLADSSQSGNVVGDGSAASCTGDAFIDAVALGGIITFDCGPEPVTIILDRPAQIFNDTGPDIVIDGGGLVTLSGGGTTRILYMNTCDERLVWTTSHCNDQDHPRLTLQNLTFIDGNSKNETEYDGGGAVYASGGRLKIHSCRFFNNVCADTGPDVGGGAVRAFQQSQGLPVYVVNSTFGGQEGYGNVCSNGGALSSIGVSWSIYDSEFSYNRAIGNGGNPAQEGTPGGGSGGAIYNDGGEMTLSLHGVTIQHNEVNAFGSAIMFVSNNHTGNVEIFDSSITQNIGGSWYPTYPQISNHDDTPISVENSTIE